MRNYQSIACKKLHASLSANLMEILGSEGCRGEGVGLPNCHENVLCDFSSDFVAMWFPPLPEVLKSDTCIVIKSAKQNYSIISFPKELSHKYFKRKALKTPKRVLKVTRLKMKHESVKIKDVKLRKGWRKDDFPLNC